MIKKVLVILLIYAAGVNAKSQIINPQLAKMLQDTLFTYASQISNIKGISASVYIPGQGIWQGTYGLSYAGKPITSDMAFGIASNSKLFVATIMLKLAENGIISLNDSLKHWLPIYKNVNQDITIRQLLNHTSGISDPIFLPPLYDTINAYPNRVFTPNEVLNYLGVPMFSPGKGWYYSNINYILAGMIAQKATGIHISKLIRDSLLKPLNMDSTFYDVEEPETGIIAHRWWNGVDYHDTSRVALNTAAGAAGPIFSNASEMVQWYKAIFNGKIINNSSMNELTTFITTSNPAYKYGLGIARETTLGLTYFTHGGDTWGYKSKMIHDTCLGINVCVLSNSFPSGIPAITFLLYRVVKNHIPGCSLPINGINTICAGTNNVTYTVPAIPNATSYLWTLPSGASGTSNTNSIEVNFGVNALSGHITVTGVNAFGMGGYASTYITVNPIPQTPIITQNHNTLISSAATGNQWYNSDGIISGANQSKYTISQSDTYYCIVTQQGCISDTSNFLYAEYTGLLNEDFNNKISIEPNPFSVSATLNSPTELNNASLQIYNSMGQMVRVIKNINGKKTILERNNLTSGLYFIRLSVDNNILSERKVIITD